MPETKKAIDCFSFIKLSEGKEYLWSPVRNGHWAQDNQTGGSHADDVLDAIVANDHPNLLGHVVKMIMRSEEYDGVEVGFFHRIAVRATAAGKPGLVYVEPLSQAA